MPHGRLTHLRTDRLIKGALFAILLALIGVVAYRFAFPDEGGHEPERARRGEPHRPAGAEPVHEGTAGISSVPFAETRLTIQVVGVEDGAGVDGVSVRLQAGGGAVLEEVTRAGGHAAFPAGGIEGERAWLALRHPGYVDAVVDLVVEAGHRQVEIRKGAVVVARVNARSGSVPEAARVHLAGARVVEDASPKPRVRSVQVASPDAEGTCRFEGVPIGEAIRVWATAPGYVAQPAHAVVATTSEGMSPISFRLDPLMSLDLRIVDAEAGTDVDLSSTRDVRVRSGKDNPLELLAYSPVNVPAEVRSRAADGRTMLFRATWSGPVGVVPCEVTVLAPGYLPWRGRLEVHPCAEDGGRPSLVALQPIPGTRLCRIQTRSGIASQLPLTIRQGDTVVASFPGAFMDLDHVVCRVPAGKVRMELGRPGYTSGQVVQIEQGDGVQVVEVDARSDLCSLEVAPVDPDGNNLEFFSIVNFRSSAIEDPIFSSLTISDGRPFRIPNFPAGRLTFFVDAPGHARTAVEVDVNPGEVRRLRPVLASKP